MSREAIRAGYLADEAELVRGLSAVVGLDRAARQRVSARAAELVRQVRSTGKVGMMESFLAEYGLSTEEGVALMCLAEAMLRVPDADTVDELIHDKITPHDWASHIGDSGSILVNASTWALLLTGRVLEEENKGVAGTLRQMVRRLGEPVIRKAVGQAMAEMGAQFVLGRNIQEAMQRGRPMVKGGYSYSFDMLGEAARTDADAWRYHEAYAAAIAVIGKEARAKDIRDNPGISVKLSALHPRYERAQAATSLPELSGRLLELARAARDAGIGFNIDAEEADRLDLSLDVVETVLADPSLKGWDGFGIAVQAFGRRALPVIDWLHDLADRLERRIMLRLVKGAYWDMEVKRAQVIGLSGFPVFTRKCHTDVSYMACASRLLRLTDRIYPQFATHNAHSVAAILEMAGNNIESFEFQRLHGMGEALHRAVHKNAGTRCRIYAPVGAHEDLLAYLVRRLLENGANSSFVNQIVDLSVPAEIIAADPIDQAEATAYASNPAITLPVALFAPRQNSQGWDLSDPVDLARIEAGRAPFMAPHQWKGAPLTPTPGMGPSRPVINPANPDDVVGEVCEAFPDLVTTAIKLSADAQSRWQRIGAAARARTLRLTADLYEARTFELLALLTREAGKTLTDGVAEIREAVDFLRYYADEAEKIGDNVPARGVIVCISPWNFPLAIFTGQIAAALAAGNTVIAKPAEQTPLIASMAVWLMHEAGVQQSVVQLMPGDGPGVGGALISDPRIAGVCFTGSTDVARLIDRQLAQTVPGGMLIAETGGLNAMIVDSTALLEQAVRDIVRAAFQSAGQRCSALRMLYVQKDVAKKLETMLFGAMDALVVGDPWQLASDVGPIIDKEAHSGIMQYCREQAEAGRVAKQLTAPEHGVFVPPTVIRVGGIENLEREIFGPVLHIATFAGEDIEKVVDAINAKGYGLTFGLHTRIDRRVQRVLDRIHVGNLYVNRDQIGAIVGSQPFGGHGLSGTGPKAGGPLYLPAFYAPEDGGPAFEEPEIHGSATDIGRDLVASALATLDATHWHCEKDRIGRLRTALRGRAAAAMSASAALDRGPLDLPGPTGESNQLELLPRGIVLCLGPGDETLLAQAVQALAAGNAVLAVAEHASRALRPLLKTALPLHALDGSIEPQALTNLRTDLVALHNKSPGLAAICQALAARSGPIVPLVTSIMAPAAYCLERSICIDTTAAGGNATLLSEAGA